MGVKKTYLAVILIQLIYTAMFLVSKAAFDGGMNIFVFVFYRQAIATFFLIPLALFFEWKRAPPLSFVTFCKIFMLSLCGITISLDVNNIALIYTSATLAAATTNTLPVITFFLALLLKTEVLKLRSKAGAAKLAGILVCMGGAVTIAFYKGPHFQLSCHYHFLGHQSSQQVHHHASSGNTWIKGVFLMLMSNTFWGLWLVLQGRVLKAYPSKLLLTTLQCLLSSIQSFAVAISVERDPAEWKLGWDLRLLSVAYCGIVVTGMTFYLQSWVIEKKGPVFLAMSTPLALVFTIFCSVILLCEAITFGSVVGAVLLIGGLYSVMWGKTKEAEGADKNCWVGTTEDGKESSELKQVVVSSS